MTPVISVENLTVEYKTPYGSVRALQNLNFQIQTGEIFGLVGESGSGKSTAAWVIMRYLADNGQVVGGEVLFKGIDLFTLKAAELRKYRGKKIAMVYQDPMTSLNPAMTVGRQIQEVIDLHQGGTKEQTWTQAVSMLEKVHISDPAASAQKYPHELSGGQKQRVVIAMALSCNPDLLILDEPTTGLDVTTEATILDLINELRAKFDSAILFISHNLGVIAKISDRIGVLYAGRMLETGPVQSIFLHPLHPYTEGLLNCIPKIQARSFKKRLEPIKGNFPNLLDLPQGCIFHPRCLYRVSSCSEQIPELMPSGIGRNSACLRWKDLQDGSIGKKQRSTNLQTAAQQDPAVPYRNHADVILELDSVKKYFGGISIFEKLAGKKPEFIHAVDGVDMQIKAGQVYGMVGESGCGKTTLGRSIIKLHRITAGTIRYKGLDVWRLDRPKTRQFHQQAQMIFQNPDSSLNPKKTVGQILARPLELYHHLDGGSLDRSTEALLEMVRLSSNYKNRYPLQISGGEKQRVGIARAFAAEPHLVVCDEPVSAVDVSVQASILNLILDLQKQFSVALLFISHDLSVVQHISHNVGIMYLGELVEVGDVDQVFSPPYHPYTEALLSAVPTVDFSAIKDEIRLVGPVPSAKRPPPGCRFHTRCPRR
ncbi:MAG: dipeptide ABC transporter ATP-binding protein, partial [Desulfobacterales bacterium]